MMLPLLSDKLIDRSLQFDRCRSPTRPFSLRLVIMTITPTFCCQIILQKSSLPDLRGPWAAMYALVRS